MKAAGDGNKIKTLLESKVKEIPDVNPFIVLLESKTDKEDEKYEKQCIKLYQEYEEAAAREQQREANSKSARIAKKLEQMRLTNDLIEKIKYRNEKR